MGLLTLTYIHLFGGKIDASKLREEDVNKDTFRILASSDSKSKHAIVLQKSSEYDEDSFLSVNNAFAYAKSVRADFFIVNDGWDKKIGGLLAEYPEGILVLDGTPRNNINQVVSLPENNGNVFDLHISVGDSMDSRDPNSKPLGIFFSGEDTEFLHSGCNYDASEKPSRSITISVLRVCGLKRSSSLLYFDESKNSVFRSE